MNRRRKVLVAVSTTIAIAGAGVGYAAFAPRLPGRGSTSAPVFVQWDTAIATVSNDTASNGDPTGPGLTPDRNGHIGQTAVPTFDAKTLVAAQTGFYGPNGVAGTGYRSTIGATAKSTAPSLLVQRWVMTDRSASVPGATPFTPGVELAVKLDPSDCGLDLKTATDRQVLADIQVLVDPADNTVNYHYALELEVVQPSAHLSANCGSW